MIKTDIKARFIVTFIANILRVGLSFIAGLFIAKSLGPGKYGDFSFLLGSFTSLISLINLATSSAFFTFICQKQRGKSFYIYYSFWVLLQFILLILLVFVLPNFMRQKIWLGHSLYLILLAGITSFSMRVLWTTTSQIGESFRDTFGVQIRNLSLAFCYLIFVLILAKLEIISIKNLLALNIVLYALLTTVYVRAIKRKFFFWENIMTL